MREVKRAQRQSCVYSILKRVRHRKNEGKRTHSACRQHMRATLPSIHMGSVVNCSYLFGVGSSITLV